jgi:hypothetical protein
MGKLLDKVLYGSPENKKRKMLEKEAKNQAKRRAQNARLAAYQKGLIAGAKKRGKEEGYRKGRGQGGLLGTLAAGANALEKSGIGKSIDFGEMGRGGGLLGDVSAFGYGPSKKKTPKKRVKKKKKYVVVNGKKYYQE